MELGAFSISLAVKDLQASRQFYEKFGFKAFAGDPAQNWLILKNGDHVIGLFQGMFDKNILTFNPGWDSNAQKLAAFTDVRELQRQLKAQGVQWRTRQTRARRAPPVSSRWIPTETRFSSISTFKRNFLSRRSFGSSCAAPEMRGRTAWLSRPGVRSICSLLTSPRSFASSQTGSLGHEVRHASITSPYSRSPLASHSRRSRIRASTTESAMDYSFPSWNSPYDCI